MKRKILVLSMVLIIALSMSVVNVSARDNEISNDKFYAVIPNDFNIVSDCGYDHYYLEDTVNYEGSIEIFVEGNLLFPYGIKDTDTEVIKKRMEYFLYEDFSDVEIAEIQKRNINGLTACYIYASTDDGLFQEELYAYIFATKENLYMVASSGIFSDDKEPEFLKEFINDFYISGTYFNGEKPSRAYDFSKAEKYMDALERDVITSDYYEYNEDLDTFAVGFLAFVLVLPVLTIVFFVLYLRTRKKLKEYKEFFGSIEQARMAFGQQVIQNGGQTYTQYNTQPVNPYNQQYNNPTAMPYNQTAQQPVQNNLPPELQDFQNNDENRN
ncbi:MAG: hypothetical protein ACI4VW_08970 [Acutalibacteraceae bacterium]